MQKEREPVGEHLLGYGFRSARETWHVICLGNAFVVYVDVARLVFIFLDFFTHLSCSKIELGRTRLAYCDRKNNGSKMLEKLVGITSTLLSGDLAS